MAKINYLNLCEVCDWELPVPSPDRCPNCGAQLRIPKNSHFEPPKYLWHQIREHQKRLQEETEHQVNAENSVSKDDLILQKEAEMRLAYLDWLKNCPDADRLAAINDAYDLLKHAVFSPLKGEKLGQFIRRCVALGKLAESIEQYYKFGGHTNGRTVTETARRNNLGSPENSEGRL